MTYLAALRVHFAGTFQANPSTVNNRASHYDEKTFEPSFQEPFSGRADDRSNWNPRGDGSWRLLGCRVTSAWHGDGGAVGAGDPVLAALVADADSQVAAKIADLDPQQQGVSMVFGLQVRIADASGTTLVGGRFAPAPFVDLWGRAPGGLGGMSAAYQSVLTDLEWGDVAASPLLTELQAGATDGLLSIRFVVDGIDANPRSSTFTLGRIVGTIGLAHAGEPSHFVAGRALDPPSGVTSANSAAAVLDAANGKVHCDLGNALPATSPGGPLAPIGSLSLACLPPDGPPLVLGSVAYEGDGWYEQTAGVVSLPADRALTPQELEVIAGAPLALLADGAAVLTEAADGVRMRADQLVYRIDAGDTAQVAVYATCFGQPLPGAQIAVRSDLSALGPTPPAVGVPSTAIAYPSLVTADALGVATLPVAASDPGNPRGYVDGQLYGIRPEPPGATGPPANPSEFVSLLVWDAFHGGDPLTWWQDVHPILQQYANLYPVMGTFVDLGDYDQVCANRELLLLAFGLDPSDPNSMPVTRDLSGAKRAAIVRWLSTPGPDGRPLLGTAPPPRRGVAAVAHDGDGAAPADDGPGGKVDALERLEAARRTAPETER